MERPPFHYQELLKLHFEHHISKQGFTTSLRKTGSNQQLMHLPHFEHNINFS